MGNFTSPTVIIQGQQIQVVEFNGQRVVTLAMVDKVHQRPEGTASRNFRENRPRFIEAEDYFEVTSDEIRRQSLGHVFPPRTPKGILLTESGYLMLVKSFTDDLAWEVQRQLVKGYFTKREVQLPSLPQSFADALRLAADLEEQKAKLQVENKQQAQRIDSLENLFLPGETPTQFCKRLNGVNTQQVNATLLELVWIYNSERDAERSPKYRVASRVRDRYLTEKPRTISAEGCDSFIKYDLQLLLAGAQRLHQFYLMHKLPMKKGWDGEFTMVKLVAEGKIGRVLSGKDTGGRNDE
ncbi:MAG TPA: phage antirepressor protein [Pseudomonas sp.]|nr:phage antirepressor protein [Pseudomonas sp.]